MLPRGESPADLLLTNAKIINTFTAEVEQGSVAIFGWICWDEQYRLNK